MTAVFCFGVAFLGAGLVLDPKPVPLLSLLSFTFVATLTAFAGVFTAALIPNEPAFKLLPDGMPVALVAA